MEKILVLIDGQGPDNVQIKLAAHLAETEDYRLSGLFIDSEAMQEAGGTAKRRHEEMSGGDPNMVLTLQQPGTSLSANKTAFANACRAKNIQWVDDQDPVSGIDDVVLASRFADILIVGNRICMDHPGNCFGAGFGKEILRKSECPVIIAPDEFDGIDEIVFAYDGSESAVYAIKQFTYHFPRLSENRIIFLQVRPENGSDITDHEKMTRYLKLHYSATGYDVLHGKPGDELYKYLAGRKNVMVVMGSFGRDQEKSGPSTAEIFLRTKHPSLFITHR